MVHGVHLLASRETSVPVSFTAASSTLLRSLGFFFYKVFFFFYNFLLWWRWMLILVVVWVPVVPLWSPISLLILNPDLPQMFFSPQLPMTGHFLLLGQCNVVEKNSVDLWFRGSRGTSTGCLQVSDFFILTGIELSSFSILGRKKKEGLSTATGSSLACIKKDIRSSPIWRYLIFRRQFAKV